MPGPTATSGSADAHTTVGAYGSPVTHEVMPTSTESGATDEGWWSRHRFWLRPLLILVVSITVGIFIIRFVGAIDWAQVGSALGQLAWWQFVPLVAALMLRQTLNAVPLAQFVKGLTLRRSMQNDLSAVVVGTLAPPPGDVVIRVAMFKSWAIDPVTGMAGVTLNMITFYSVRFLAPSVGLVFLAFEGIESGQVVQALLSLLIAVAILVVLMLLARGDSLAELLGRSAGRVAARVKSSVDPQGWADSVVSFRSKMVDTLRAGLPKSMAGLVGMVLADGLVLFLAVRFVGLGTETLSLTLIFGTFLIAYPLTIMPLAGFGVLDAALVATWTVAAGLEYEATIIAGLAVWRAVTILGPLVLGGGTLALWRRRHSDERSNRANPPGIDDKIS